jgi:hypothetical protein
LNYPHASKRLAAYADAAIHLGVPGYPHGERLPVADDRSDRARAADRPLSSDSGPYTESASPKPRLREQVIDQVENAPEETHQGSISYNRQSPSRGISRQSGA